MEMVQYYYYNHHLPGPLVVNVIVPVQFQHWLSPQQKVERAVLANCIVGANQSNASPSPFQEYIHMCSVYTCVCFHTCNPILTCF
jgi:hypothetical protein